MNQSAKMIVEKPEDYKGHFIVYDGGWAKLIINHNTTVFQRQIILGDDWQDFETVDKGDYIEIIEV